MIGQGLSTDVSTNGHVQSNIPPSSSKGGIKKGMLFFLLNKGFTDFRNLVRQTNGNGKTKTRFSLGSTHFHMEVGIIWKSIQAYGTYKADMEILKGSIMSKSKTVPRHVDLSLVWDSSSRCGKLFVPNIFKTNP